MNPSEPITSGAFANHTGNELEQFVHQKLLGHGYQVLTGTTKRQAVARKSELFTERATTPGKWFAAQVPVGLTVYASRRTVDFLVVNQDLFPDGLIIECKWQQAGGSVDEKFPFLVLNIRQTAVPTIVLLDGGGYKPGARDWLCAQVTPGSSLSAVYDMVGFHRAVNDGLLDRPTLFVGSR